jgi:hypothetical protein
MNFCLWIRREKKRCDDEAITMDSPDENALAAPIAPVKPRPQAALGWWAVLLTAVWLIADGTPVGFVPRKYYSIAVAVTRAAYAMIAARAAFAVLFRNRSWWWVAYAILLVFVGSLVVGIEQSASDDWN